MGRWGDDKQNSTTNYTVDQESLASLQTFMGEAADGFLALETSAKNEEIDEYWVSFIILADKDKDSNSLSALGG